MVELTKEGIQKIFQNIDITKSALKKQINLFEKLLARKIYEEFPEVSIQKMGELIEKCFTQPLNAKIDNMFSKIQEDELIFYEKNLKTADLVFNTIKENRNKTIYLDNIIKKIEQKEDDSNKAMENLINDGSDEISFGMSKIFKNLVEKVILFSHLTVDQNDQIVQIASGYYDKLNQDMFSTISKLFAANKLVMVRKIEDEMDKQEIRGKTTAVSKLEKKITDQAVEIMQNLLENSVNTNTEVAVRDLQVCSSAVVDLIFKLLPEEYSAQRELLEVIVDTNINERLGKVLETEIEKLKNNLNEINKDQVENELYLEKRYKEIEKYNCNFELVNKVYQDVLHEIRIAYDIPEDDYKSKRMDIIVLSEANSAKMVLKKLTDVINHENSNNLNKIKAEMHQSKNKLKTEIEVIEETTTDAKKK